jgi:hypothetical protein
MKFIVTDRNGVTMVPAKNGFAAQNQSVSLPTREEAEAFAEHLARKNVNSEFFLFELVGSVKTDSPPVKWTRLEDAG